MKNEHVFAVLVILLTIITVILIIIEPWQFVLLLGVFFTIFFYMVSNPIERRRIRPYAFAFCVVLVITFIVSYAPTYNKRWYSGSMYSNMGSLKNVDFMIQGIEPLALAAGIIILTFVFAIIICFLLKKLNVLAFLSTLWAIICVLLLFNHILFAMNNPNEIGLPEVFNKSWDFVFINLEPLKYVMVFLIASIQWFCTIGIALLVILLSSKALASLSGIINSSEGEYF